jgi:hypothetical protein
MEEDEVLYTYLTIEEIKKEGEKLMKDEHFLKILKQEDSLIKFPPEKNIPRLSFR